MALGSVQSGVHTRLALRCELLYEAESGAQNLPGGDGVPVPDVLTLLGESLDPITSKSRTRRREMSSLTETKIMRSIDSCSVV